MRRISMLVVVAGFAAGCVTSTPEQSPEGRGLGGSGQPLATTVPESLPGPAETGELGSRPDTSPDRWHAPSGTSQPADTIESAAARAVIQLLEDEGLLVLGVDSAAEPMEGPQTAIRTTVLHGTGRSHPLEASYLVTLEPLGHTWTVVSITAAS